MRTMIVSRGEPFQKAFEELKAQGATVISASLTKSGDWELRIADPPGPEQADLFSEETKP